MRTYVWYSWDMLGSEQEGWEFNDRSCSGATYELSGDESNEELVALLGGSPEEIEVDDNCDPDFSIVFVRIEDGKPLGELVAEELSCQP